MCCVDERETAGACLRRQRSPSLPPQRPKARPVVRSHTDPHRAQASERSGLASAHRNLARFAFSRQIARPGHGGAPCHLPLWSLGRRSSDLKLPPLLAAEPTPRSAHLNSPAVMICCTLGESNEASSQTQVKVNVFWKRCICVSNPRRMLLAASPHRTIAGCSTRRYSHRRMVGQALRSLCKNNRHDVQQSTCTSGWRMQLWWTAPTATTASGSLQSYSANTAAVAPSHFERPYATDFHRLPQRE